jgi:hypothetical protein
MFLTPVTSREYKIMLATNRFEDSDIINCARAFWTEFTRTVGTLVVDVDGDLDKETRTRRIRFYDTSDHRLRKQGYVVRERIDVKDGTLGDRQVTLKFRHPDRYLSQERDMRAAKPARGRSKFEEDIKPPSTHLFSYSTKQDVDVLDVATVNHVIDLFPGLKPQLPKADRRKALSVVGGVEAAELVIGGADFQIGEDPKLEAECALVVWHHAGRAKGRPAVVEFSYKYGDDNEHYRGAPAKRASDVLGILLCEAMGTWVDPQSTTKTGFVYTSAHQNASAKNECDGEGCGPPTRPNT